FVYVPQAGRKFKQSIGVIVQRRAAGFCQIIENYSE
ncbi:MAG: hypothetical protein ACI93R_002742, partial [Flavobacteriales bacterium]